MGGCVCVHYIGGSECTHDVTKTRYFVGVFFFFWSLQRENEFYKNLNALQKN